MKRKSEVIGTAIKQVVSAIETLQPEAARRVVNAAMILCEQDAGGACKRKANQKRQYYGVRVGNAKQKVIEGPCGYCEPQPDHAGRTRSEICARCKAIQDMHDAAQAGDETAAIEYIYRRAATGISGIPGRDGGSVDSRTC